MNIRFCESDVGLCGMMIYCSVNIYVIDVMSNLNEIIVVFSVSVVECLYIFLILVLNFIYLCFSKVGFLFVILIVCEV